MNYNDKIKKDILMASKIVLQRMAGTFSKMTFEDGSSMSIYLGHEDPQDSGAFEIVGDDFEDVEECFDINDQSTHNYMTVTSYYCSTKKGNYTTTYYLGAEINRLDGGNRFKVNYWLNPAVVGSENTPESEIITIPLEDS